jgi:hypothetical protein
MLMNQCALSRYVLLLVAVHLLVVAIVEVFVVMAVAAAEAVVAMV